jgi:hypothetical protein
MISVWHGFSGSEVLSAVELVPGGMGRWPRYKPLVTQGERSTAHGFSHRMLKRWQTLMGPVIRLEVMEVLEVVWKATGLKLEPLCRGGQGRVRG